MNMSWQQTMSASQGVGATLTAAAAASAIPSQAKFTLPANFLNNLGQQLLIKASGKISTVITTPGTARFDVRFGSTVVWDSQAIALDASAAYTNVGWYLEVLLTLTTVGSAATLVGQGTFSSPIIAGNPATPPKGSLTALLPWNTTPGSNGNTFDATAAQAVDFFFTQTVATGSQTLIQYSMWSLN